MDTQPAGGVRISEFSTEEHVAFNYVLAELYPQHFRARYERFCAKLNERGALAGLAPVSTHDFKQAIFRGLQALAGRGVLMVKKDGEGVYQPSHLCVEKLVWDGEYTDVAPKLIVGDGN